MPGPNLFSRFSPSAAAFLLISAAFLTRSWVGAQELNLSIATTYNINDQNAVDGDVMCFDHEGKGQLNRCAFESDDRIFGILTDKPQVVLRGGASQKPLTRQGNVMVNVSTINGNIDASDYVTSSEIAGKAEKATQVSGWVIGRALKPFSTNDGTKSTHKNKQISTGQIPIALSIGPAEILPKGNILDKMGFLLLKNVQAPGGATIFLRYIIAGLVTILVTAFAFTNFGHNITKGVESVGRNPLASRNIQFIVLVNVVLIAMVTIGGIILSLAIIRL
jgi:hypothetical protein